MSLQDLEAEILSCEDKLLHADTRGQPGMAEALLAPEFEEVSAAGITDRAQVLHWLRNKEPGQRWQFHGFRIKRLSDDLVLAHYQAQKAGQSQVAGQEPGQSQTVSSASKDSHQSNRQNTGQSEASSRHSHPSGAEAGQNEGTGKRARGSLRTSVWRFDRAAGQWQLVFHQATRLD